MEGVCPPLSWHRPDRMDTQEDQHGDHGHAHQGHGHQGHAHHGHGHHGHAHHGHAHHGHASGHHHHAPAAYDRAFAIGAGVNLTFTLAEAGFGFAANSVALIADATHNLGDVLGLLLGWLAVWLHRRPPSGRRTYGWGRFSIAAAFGNAGILLISVGAILMEAWHRLHEPAPVASTTVMLVAGVGVLVNGGSALLFLRGRHGDLNIRAQYLHLAGDAAVSLAVVVAAGLIRVTGSAWIDPAISVLIAVLVTWSSFGALREAADLAMDAVPAGISQAAVRDWLASLPGVSEVHDLHIWALSTTETALTVHLVCQNEPEDRRPYALAADLRRRFGIGHATVQFESAADAALCRLRPNDVV